MNVVICYSACYSFFGFGYPAFLRPVASIGYLAQVESGSCF